MKDKYKYLVSFAHDKGVGSTVITLNQKIRCEKNVNLIQNFIEAKTNLGNVSIMNFILLDKKWGVWDWFVAIVELILLLFCVLAMIASIFV